MRRPAVLQKARGGQVAVADAVLALVILTIASAIIYSSVAASITGRSESRQRTDLRNVAYETAGLPLEASCAKVSYDNLTGNKAYELVNATGEELMLTYLELKAHSDRTGDSYDLTRILKAIRELYQLALDGRSYAVLAHGSMRGTAVELLFSSELEGNQEAMTSASEIPHPRVVVQKELYVPDGDISVDLYLWK